MRREIGVGNGVGTGGCLPLYEKVGTQYNERKRLSYSRRPCVRIKTFHDRGNLSEHEYGDGNGALLV